SQGLPALSEQAGAALFTIALSRTTGSAVVGAMRVDTGVLRARRDVIPALLRGLAPQPRHLTAATAEGGIAARLVGLGVVERVRVVVEWVRAEVAGVLGHASVDAIDPGRAFQELGFDSLTAIELRNRLGV